MRRSVSLLAVSLALGGGAAPSASAAALPVDSRATPLAITTYDGPNACPTKLDGDSTSAALTTELLRRAARLRGEAADTARFASWLMFSTAADEPMAVIAVCDPELAAAGTPIGSFTGTAAAPPPIDAVGPGFRSRSGSLGAADGAAAVGDRFVLPPVGPRASVLVVVHTTGGAASTTVGPFAAVPTAVEIEGRAAAPVVRVDLADGTQARTPVVVPAATSVRLRATVRPHALRLRLRTTPGVLAAILTPSSGDDLRIAGFDDDGDLATVGPKGVLTLTQKLPGTGARTVRAYVLDAVRRIETDITCKLKWRKGLLRSAACRAAATRALAAGPSTTAGTSATVTGVAPVASPAARRSALRARVTARASASKARAANLAPVAATAVRQGGSEEIDLVEDTGGFLFADLSGDGRPDFSFGDPLSDATVLISNPTGWNAVPATLDPTDVPGQSLADVTGDGNDDLFSDDGRVFAGHPEWSTTLPAKIDLSAATAVGPRDLAALDGGGPFDAVPLVPMADETGDGRPELGVEAHGALGIFASEQLPLGVKPTLPDVVPLPASVTLADPATIVRRSADQLIGSFSSSEARGVVASPPTNKLFSVRGGAVVSTISWTVRGTDARSVVALRRLATSRPWTLDTATPSTELAGIASVTDFDPVSGETLVATSTEACNRRSACVSRVRRIGPDGAILATASVRGSAPLSARFVDDGPDVDTRLDVAIYQEEPVRTAIGATTPADQGTIALWPSSTVTTSVATLPVLAAGGSSIVIDGTIQSWTAPDGHRFLAGYRRVGKRGLTLTLIGAPQ